MMKRCFLWLMALTLLCAAGNATAQDLAPAIVTTAESPIRLGGTGDDVCYDRLTLTNGDLILSLSSAGGRNGQAPYARNAKKVWLICLAPDGSTVWEKDFGEDRGDTLFLRLRESPDGSVSGTVTYSIDQWPQYTQQITLSGSDGALLSEGEKELESKKDDSVNTNVYLAGDRTLTEETHDCNATCRPRLFRLTDNKGQELWCLDVDELGISSVEDWINLPTGALLYGRNWDDQQNASKPAAILVNDAGKVLWRTELTDVPDGFINDAILDSQDRVVAVGISRSQMKLDENGHGLGYDDQKQLLLCLNPDTGEVIWRHENTRLDQALPFDNLQEVDKSYLLCDSDTDFSVVSFELLDWNGQPLTVWRTTLPDTTWIYPRLIRWNNEFWVASYIQQDDSADVYLERLQWPDGFQPSEVSQ